MKEEKEALRLSQNKADEVLIALFKQGQKEAFNEIFNRYQKKIYSFLYYLTQNQDVAEDLAQNAFLNAYKAINAWSGAGSFKNWLYKIAYREALGFWKKQKRRPEVFSEEGDLPEIADDTEDIAVGLANREIVEQVLSHLPEMYKTVLLLRYYSELSYEEIAASTLLPMNTVRTHLRRAKAAFEQALNNL